MRVGGFFDRLMQSEDAPQNPYEAFGYALKIDHANQTVELLEEEHGDVVATYTGIRELRPAMGGYDGKVSWGSSSQLNESTLSVIDSSLRLQVHYTQNPVRLTYRVIDKEEMEERKGAD